MKIFYIRFNKSVKKIASNKIPVFFIALLTLLTNAVYSQNVTVSTLLDVVDGDTSSVNALNGSKGTDGKISLREAILASNKEPVGSTINIILGSGNHILTRVGNDNTGDSGDLDINVDTILGRKTIIITGAGSALTTITGVPGERIFDVHALPSKGSISFSVTGVKLTGGSPATGSGGAILAGSEGDSTIITDCNFINNRAASNGGAISQSSGSSTNRLVVRGSEFTNNRARGGVGGAINFSGNGGSSIIIDKNIFNKDTANTQGGAINITGDGFGPAVANITNNVFTENGALGAAFGGAVGSTVNAVIINFMYNRILNNDAPNVSQGKLFTSGGGTTTLFNVDNNWWGSNTGPASSDNLGTTSTKYLQLKSTASPDSVCINSPSTVTSGFLSNSLGEAIDVANLYTLIGLPVSFVNPVLGALSSPQATIQSNGTATVLYTSGSTGGAGSVNAKVDNVQNNDPVAKASITINQVNADFSGLAANYCIGDGAVTLTGSPAGGTFSGLGISGNTFTPADAGVGGPYNIQYTFTDEIGCVGTKIKTVTINALPVVNFSGLASTYCVNNANVTLTGSPAGGTFGGTGISGNTFSPSLAGVGGPYTINYTYSDANGCSNTINKTVTVNSQPVVSFSGLATSYCIDALPVTLSGSPAGGTFSGAGITGNSFDPGAAGVGPHTITYSYTDAVTGCSNSANQNVSVNSLPNVSFSGLASSYCINEGPVNLTGTPSGGTFSGNGISGNTFNPAAAGTGTHTISYSYSNGSACSNSSNQQVTVNNLPVVSFSGLASAYCVNESAVTLSGSPAGGTFSGNGISGNTFNPAIAGVGGPYTISYTYTDVNGCSNSTNKTVIVNPLPVVSFSGLNATYCVNDGVQALTGNPAGGAFSGTGISGNNFDPAAASVGGPYAITYTYTDVNGCSNSSVQNVTVNSLGSPGCSGALPTFLNNGAIVGHTSCGNNDGSLTIIPLTGVAPFMYSIDGGSTYVSGPDAGFTFLNLAVGDYSMRLKDNTGTESVIITRSVVQQYGVFPTFLNNNQILLNPTCDNDGNISIIPTSGTPPFMYSIDGGSTYVAGPDGGYTFLNLGPGTYQLRMKEASGCASDIVERTLVANCNRTSLKSNNDSEIQTVTVYPNPSRGQFKVQLNKFLTPNAQVSVFDGKGTLVQQKKVYFNKGNTIDFNLGNKAPGLYLIKIVSDKGTITSRVMIHR